MKKNIVFLMSLCALAFVSCQKEADDLSYDNAEQTFTYQFEGSNNLERLS